MIVSKPQTSTLASFAAFLLISSGLIGFNTVAAIRDSSPSWLNLTVIVLLTPLALFALFKIFLSYKVIRVGNNQIDIRYPVFGKTKKYTLDQIGYWKETVIKNSMGTYKEIEVGFTDKSTLNMGHKEYTEYSKIAGYLSQKAAKKKK
ncbi:MAG TPA: hypothetical protein VFE57_01745 [Cyclobacteriaceae bacterium]|nr:hypothetical protein [Cyclobacteriaceae bacterium]